MAPQFDIATRAQIVTMKFLGLTTKQINEHLRLHLDTSNIRRIYEKATSRGFGKESPVLLDLHVNDSPRSGRPTKQTAEKVAEIEGKVTKDRFGREKSAEYLSREVEISSSTVQRILKRQGYSKTKPTRKPGLTAAQKQARLAWCLQHKDKPDSWWHNIIWTDETSVLLGQRRGGYKIWRKPQERVVRSCIRARWKGYSEFIFWGSFSYFSKGPCHIFRPESASERKRSELKVRELNAELEPLKKVLWQRKWDEKARVAKRRPSKQPEWKWSSKTGKLERSKRGGIDWFRYWSEIQMAKLIPFAKETGGVIIEDGAPCHKHWFVQQTYDVQEVLRASWAGNSPDLNAIEPVWFDLKRITTKKGAPETRKAAEEAWLTAWEEYPQERLQNFVDRIRIHIDKVIELEGGNEYIEGLQTRQRARNSRIYHDAEEY